MQSESETQLARYYPQTGPLLYVLPELFPWGFFSASPTVLEAINTVLEQRGLPTLWVQEDGTIGPQNPVEQQVVYIPTPFSN
jgi:hypothetical protein